MKQKLNIYNANDVLSPLNKTIVKDSIMIIEIKVIFFLKDSKSVLTVNKNNNSGKNLAV